MAERYDTQHIENGNSVDSGMIRLQKRAVDESTIDYDEASGEKYSPMA